MPRISAEQRASRLFLTGHKPPQPPSDLGKPAADHWRTIVRSRPPDFFDGGVQGLLQTLCSALAECSRVAQAMAAEPVGTPQSAALTKDYAVLCGIAMSLARSLRLTKQSIDKKSGAHDERAPPVDHLIGASVLRPVS